MRIGCRNGLIDLLHALDCVDMTIGRLLLYDVRHDLATAATLGSQTTSQNITTRPRERKKERHVFGKASKAKCRATPDFTSSTVFPDPAPG